MKNFYEDGERCASSSLVNTLKIHITRFIDILPYYRFGWLAYTLGVPKVTGIQLLMDLFSSMLQHGSRLTQIFFANPSSPSRSIVEDQSKRLWTHVLCVCLSVVFLCAHAGVAKEAERGGDGEVQVAENPKSYQIGDKLPKDFVIGYNPFDSLKIVKLSDFKGKAVILDAWATWCGSCISKFPVLDSLSKVYGDGFQVLLVGMLDRDNPETVSRFVTDYLEEHPGFSPTFVIEQPRLNDSFTFRSLPHYIWIDPNRRVRAFTGTDAFQDGLIRRLLMGMPIYTPVKLR